MRYVAVPLPAATSVLKGRPGIVGDLEHPRDRGARGGVRHATQLAGERTVDRLGELADVRARLPEVTRERLREDHQVGTGRDALGEAGTVGGGIEPARPLVHADPQLVTHGVQTRAPRIGG